MNFWNLAHSDITLARKHNFEIPWLPIWPFLAKNWPNWPILPYKKLFGLLIFGWKRSRNSRNLILSWILGLGIFLGQILAKLAKVDFRQICSKCYFPNFAYIHPRKTPSPKIQLKIKFLEFLDLFQPKMSRPNNFFGAKLANFWPKRPNRQSWNFKTVFSS